MIKLLIIKVLIIIIIFLTNETLSFNQTTIETNTNNNNNSNTLTRQEFLAQNLGERKHKTSFVIAMSTVYILILICGLFGNISTCCVIIFNSCMHTTTNYYLFSLAVSDVLSLLIGLPVELTELYNGSYPWIFGYIFCKTRIFIFETTTIASVLTILMFTCERWLHICKAIYAKKFSNSFSRALKIILCIWALSGFLSLPFAFTSGTFLQLDGYPESKLCGSLMTHRQMMSKFIISYAVLFFIIPMTMISIMYVLIGIKLWKSQIKFTNTKDSISTSVNSTRTSQAFRLKISKLVANKKRESLNNNNNNVSSTLIGIRNGSITDDNSTNQIIKQLRIDENISANIESISDKAKQSRRDVVKMLC